MDDCFIHGCLLLLDVSLILFRMCLFFIIVLTLSLWIFDLSLLVEDKFCSQMISETVGYWA